MKIEANQSIIFYACTVLFILTGALKAMVAAPETEMFKFLVQVIAINPTLSCKTIICKILDLDDDHIVLNLSNGTMAIWDLKNHKEVVSIQPYGGQPFKIKKINNSHMRTMYLESHQTWEWKDGELMMCQEVEASSSQAASKKPEGFLLAADKKKAWRCSIKVNDIALKDAITLDDDHIALKDAITLDDDHIALKDAITLDDDHIALKDAITLDDDHIALSSSNGVMIIWDLKNDKQVLSITPYEGKPFMMRKINDVLVGTSCDGATDNKVAMWLWKEGIIWSYALGWYAGHHNF